jgi:hypothetical protein
MSEKKERGGRRIKDFLKKSYHSALQAENQKITILID